MVGILPAGSCDGAESDVAADGRHCQTFLHWDEEEVSTIESGIIRRLIQVGYF